MNKWNGWIEENGETRWKVSNCIGTLGQVMRRSAAMFLCVVDLSESKEKICESLHYWLSFIDNACSTAEGRSHVVIVGSHVDQVTSSGRTVLLPH